MTVIFQSLQRPNSVYKHKQQGARETKHCVIEVSGLMQCFLFIYCKTVGNRENALQGKKKKNQQTRICFVYVAPLGENASMLQLNYLLKERKCYFSALTSCWIAAPLVCSVKLINLHQWEKERKKALSINFMAFIPALEHYALKKISSLSPPLLKKKKKLEMFTVCHCHSLDLTTGSRTL